MDSHKLQNLLSDYKKEDVERYIRYIEKLIADGKSIFITKYTEDRLAQSFRLVASEWLTFDGVHITHQSTGISYDYQALKNKMLIAYPETVLDVSLVYEWDEISFWKDSGKISYTHKLKDPFGNREDKDIIGAYAIIRNKRWEYLTTLNKAELEKHRKTAKTDYIWKAWFAEMCMKTIMKKACKTHFGDVYDKIEEMDNENYDANRVNKWQEEIDKIETIEDLSIYYLKNKGQGEDFDKAIANKKKALLSNKKENDNPQS